MSRIALRLYDRFTGLRGICIYCGVPAATIDHVMPVSIVSANLGLIRYRKLIKVPACPECNSIAGDRLFRSVGAKGRYVRGRLKIKYKRLLKCKDWTREELEEIGYTLRTTFERDLRNRAIVKERVKWQNQNTSITVNANGVGRISRRTGNGESFATSPVNRWSIIKADLISLNEGRRLRKVDRQFWERIYEEYGLEDALKIWQETTKLEHADHH